MNPLGRLAVLWLSAILAIARPDNVAAFYDTTITAEAGSIAALGDIKNNTINQNINNLDLTKLPEFVKAFSDQQNTSKELLDEAKRKRDEIAASLKMTQGAVDGFFETLGEQNVPPERLTAKLVEIATEAVAARQRLAALEPDNPVTKALADQAKAELDKGHPDAASALLQRAEEADLAAAMQARAISQQAIAAADAKQLHAAGWRESRGNIALTQLHYTEAADHFSAAKSLVPAGHADIASRYLERQASALYRQGDERGDNTAQAASISI